MLNNTKGKKDEKKFITIKKLIFKMDFLLGQYFKWLNMGNYDYKYRSKKQMILF